MDIQAYFRSAAYDSDLFALTEEISRIAPELQFFNPGMGMGEDGHLRIHVYVDASNVPQELREDSLRKLNELPTTMGGMLPVVYIQKIRTEIPLLKKPEPI